MWERRSIYGYLTGTLLGPLAGIPFVSQVVSGAIGGANYFLPKEYRAWMPTASMLPMGDIERTLRDWKKWEKGSWEDRCIIAENTLRALAGIGAACFSEPTTACCGIRKLGVCGADVALAPVADCGVVQSVVLLLGGKCYLHSALIGKLFRKLRGDLHALEHAALDGDFRAAPLHFAIAPLILK